MISRGLIVITFALGSLAALPALAQEAVPRELADALFLGESRATLLIGRAPRGLDATPEGATVLGSVVHRSSARIAYSIALPPEAAAAAFASRLAEAGLTPPPPRDGTHLASALPPTERILCEGDTMRVSVSAMPRPAGGSWVQVARYQDGPAGTCAPAGSVERTHDEIRSMIPRLVPPPGMEPRETVEASGWNMSTSSSFVLRSSEAPGAILAHFARQMRDAGWTAAEVAATASVAAQSYEITRPDGQRWFATLSITALPDDGRAVEVSARTKSRPADFF
ncbi:MAG TPA: hypothetical protein VFQ39_14200 [Longimicrobium sp.]|nr:hypothetical protein [Longimicrobium sp.]